MRHNAAGCGAFAPTQNHAALPREFGLARDAIHLEQQPGAPSMLGMTFPLRGLSNALPSNAAMDLPGKLYSDVPTYPELSDAAGRD